MNHIFLELLNHTLMASFLILAVMLVRVLIRRAPKWLDCALWGVVALRLILPFNIESVLSLVPTARMIPHDIEYAKVPYIESGVATVNQLVNPVLAHNFTSQQTASANPIQIAIFVGAILWLIGSVSLLLYAFISYVILRRKVAASKNVSDNVYVCDEVRSPFILGMIRPRIYLPSDLSKDTMACVCEHESAHLKRYDHWWKPLGFLLLAIYWFNPLCWAAYLLLCKDIELACDEKVTKDKEKEWKANYCEALLACHSQRRRVVTCPVAFGEVSVKARVRTILNHKKPAFWGIVAAILLSIIVAVCFMTSPKTKQVLRERAITYIPAVVDEHTMPGPDGIQIDCEKDGTIAFHDYYGLFIYDIANRRLRTSLDLESIGCNATQGDAACEVLFGEGTIVFLHAMNSDSMYAFDYKTNTVTEEAYDPDKYIIGSNCVPLTDHMERDPNVYQSYLMCVGEGDYIGPDEKRGKIPVYMWLQSDSGRTIDLCMHTKFGDYEEEIAKPIFKDK